MNIEKEREAFEGWFSKEFRCDEWVYNPFGRMEFNNIDAYSCSTVNTVWSAWLAAKTQAIPDGFVVVPVEPTQKMVDEFPEVHYQDTYAEDCSLWVEDEIIKLGYKAMIGAVE